MKAFVKTPGQKPSIVEIEKPEPRKNEVLLRVLYVGICRTDIYVASEKIWRGDPIILGHEFSAQVEYANEYSKFKKGQYVTVDPLYGKNFMGLHFNGAICEYICVPESQIYAVIAGTPIQHAAYAEPVAASMAVLKADLRGRGAIYGNNRISLLTQIIADSYGHQIPIISEKEPIAENVYDFIIETQSAPEDTQKICWGLKPYGRFILKSRRTEVSMPLGVIVLKDLNLQGVGYGDWNETIKFLFCNHEKLDALLGKIFPFAQSSEAFAFAGSGEEKKTFIRVGVL